MKTKNFITVFASLLISFGAFAQDKTTVTATSSDISDNLDLRAVASIFGDSKDLEDFENRLNDPKSQISNLDLNNDNQVDYLRVIESVENNVHLVVIQDVLSKDVYQDIATIEVQKQANNDVRIQVVGDVYMYGSNYIYEPVYVTRPIIYTHFWTVGYNPYYSNWYWGYYPSYYYAWTPFPLFKYRHNIGLFINFNNHYNYGHVRHCQVVYNNYYGRRGSGYERQYPNRSFTDRHNGYSNRQELDNSRKNTRSDVAFNTTRNNTDRNSTVRSTTDSPVRSNTTRSEVSTTRNDNSTPIRVATDRNNQTSRNNESTPVKYETTRTETPIKVAPTKDYQTSRSESNTSRTSTPIKVETTRNTETSRSNTQSSSRNSNVGTQRSSSSNTNSSSVGRSSNSGSQRSSSGNSSSGRSSSSGRR